jgi:hypothetical protein
MNPNISASASTRPGMSALPDIAACSLPSSSATPVAAALCKVSNADEPTSSAPTAGIRLEDVPERFRQRFAALRSAGEEQPSRPAKAPWPPAAGKIIKEIFGNDFGAYSEYHRGMFKQQADTSSEIPGPPTWPRTNLEIRDGTCRLQSPKGNVQVEFPIAANEIRVTFSGRENVIRFADKRRLARCGVAVPQYWAPDARKCRHEPEWEPVYAIDRFQALVLSPDEKTVFCILEKSDGLPVLQKIQEEHAELIAMPPELAFETSHISGMACNAAGALFIYCGQSGKERLHVLEDGQWCHLNLYHADPLNDPEADPIIDPASAFFISAVAPDGSSLVLTPHAVEQSPRLIRLKDTCRTDRPQDDKPARRLEYWKLVPAGSPDNWEAPCLFAYSPNSKHLALTGRNLFATVLSDRRSFIIDLWRLSPATVPIGGNLPTFGNMGKIGRALWIERPDWTALPGLIDPNHLSFSFEEQGLGLTKAAYDAKADVTMTYTAGLPPSMVLRPLFAPLAQRAQEEIAKFKRASKSTSKSTH